MVRERSTPDRRQVLCHITPAGLALALDVTDRRRAEAALLLRDRAMQAATQGIVIANVPEDDCPIVYASPAFEQMTGYHKDEIVGRNCRFLQGPETDQAVVDRVRGHPHGPAVRSRTTKLP